MLAYNKLSTDINGTCCGFSEWYAVHTRSNFEKRVASDFVSREIESYLPAYEERHRWKDRTQTVIVPLFPGYVFVRRANVDSTRRLIMRTPGVVRILGTQLGPEAIHEQELKAVRTMLDSRLRCSSHPLLNEGVPVRVIRGPLKGVEGLLVRFKNQARLVVSVRLIGKSVSVELDSADIRPL